MRDVAALHPALQEKIILLKAECQKQGLNIGIGECVRTADEQDALYAKGRTAPGKIVTNAKGSTYSSMHQWGVAADFYRNDGKGAYYNDDGFFGKVGQIGKNLGLVWGGDWKNPVDMPHFQLSDWGKSTKKLKSIYKTPQNFMDSWEVIGLTKNEREEINGIKSDVSKLTEIAEKLTERQERIYHFFNELPDWARPTMEKLEKKGIYSGLSDADLNLPENMMRTLVINDRAGVYDD